MVCVVCACGRSAEFERDGGAQLQNAEEIVAVVGRRGWGVPSSSPDANTAPREGAAHTHAAQVISRPAEKQNTSLMLTSMGSKKAADCSSSTVNKPARPAKLFDTIRYSQRGTSWWHLRTWDSAARKRGNQIE